MPWHSVEVIEPPAVESLSVRLFPPSYTGRPPTTGERHLRGLCGTGVEITGEATKPLSAARIILEGAAAIPAEIGADGRRFHVGPSRWRIEKSGSYRFELTDRDGIRGGADDRWPIDAVADAPPQVAIEQPAADLYVAPEAVVPIRISAHDDLAVREIDLAIKPGDPLREQSRRLFTGPRRPAPRAGDSLDAVSGRDGRRSS